MECTVYVCYFTGSLFEGGEMRLWQEHISLWLKDGLPLVHSFSLFNSLILYISIQRALLAWETRVTRQVKGKGIINIIEINKNEP